MKKLKKLKKLAAIVLASAMVLASGSVAMAATTSSTDTGSVTINGLNGGTSVSAYQIAKATYDANGNFLGYEMSVAGDFDFTIEPDGSYDEAALTEANLAALFDAVINTTPYTASISQGQESATIANLPVGSYLIVIEGSESTVYGMMIGSVSYAVSPNSGEWTVSGGRFDVADCELWAKATTPTVLKEETGGHLGDYEHGGSADVGDTIAYHITVSNIPSYQGAYPEFIVTDEISSELSITAEELAALRVLDAQGNVIENSLYTVTRTDSGFTVDFVVDGKYTLNDYAGSYIVIEFCADVVSAAETADDHENDVTLTYATTSYTTGSEGEDTDADHEYTFAMKAMKTDTESTPLVNAEFTLYTDEDCSTAYTQNGTAVTATSGPDGSFTFTGLEEGTYYLKETTAPDGYLLNQAVYKVEISATYTAADSKNGGTLSSWSIVITDEEGDVVATATSSVDTNLTIVNTKAGLLPSMGGRGTLLFTLIGCAVVACAAVGVVVIRRKKAA